MCLLTNNKIAIAQEDITVYKVLEKSDTYTDVYRAIFRQYMYSKGIRASISESLHLEPVDSMEYPIRHIGAQEVNRGFHSFTIFDEAKRFCNLVSDNWRAAALVVCRCKIPKGAEYVIGKFFSYVSYESVVSNELIVENEIE